MKNQKTQKIDCKHSNMKNLDYKDEDILEDCKKMDVYAIQRKYPRVVSTCPDCGANVLTYSSYTHYIAGDW